MVLTFDRGRQQRGQKGAVFAYKLNWGSFNLQPTVGMVPVYIIGDFGVESWTGVLERILRVEPWRDILE